MGYWYGGATLEPVDYRIGRFCPAHGKRKKVPVPSGRLGGDSWGKCTFCAGLRGLQADLDEDDVCWNRIGDAELALEAGKMLVDRHRRASIYSPHPVGLARVELKWGVPVKEDRA